MFSVLPKEKGKRTALGKPEAWDCLEDSLLCNKPPQTSVVENNNHFLTFTGVRWVGSSGRVWPSGSSPLQGAGWGHLLGCVQTVVGLGKEVPGGFIHASAASMLLHVTPPPPFSLSPTTRPFG